MKEKTIALLITATIIVLFAITMIWQYFLFNFGNNQFVLSIENSIKYARDNKWDLADAEAQKVDKMWQNGNALVAIKFAESDFSALSIYLIKFDKALKQKDINEAEKEGVSAIAIFKNITSIASAP